MIRAVLISLLCGMLIGAEEVTFLVYPVLREQAAQVTIMAGDVHAIRANFELGLRMSHDGAVHAEVLANTKLMPVPGKPVGKKLKVAK